MGPMGFEPMTFRLWAGRSTWLSYGPQAPSTGLEPVTNRLTAERSTYWATMAYNNPPAYQIETHV